MSEKSWTVYIVQSESGAYYTGITTDLNKRFEQHQHGRKGARFFRLSSPKQIVYTEQHSNRSEASKREAQIKRLTRAQKEALVAGHGRS